MNSTQTVVGLLEQYNKNNPYRKIASTAPASNTNRRKIGTWSYANMYDALYDKYSRYRNFNANMWQEAIKLGEEDQYLAFLDANKDTVLSDQFYDPQYYDYETMMMELFLPFADVSKTEMYTQSVYDPASGDYVDEEIGELTQRQYYEYLLNNVRTLREQEITRDLEQWRKDQLGFWEKLGHDVLATLGEFGEGLLSGLTGVVDFVAAVGTLGLMPYSMNGNEGNYLDAFVDYFGENGLTAYEKRTVRAALDEYERTHTRFRDINGNITGVGTYVAGIANSLGMMVPAIVAAYFTAGTSLAWMGTATFYASIFSNNMYENATNPALANSPAYLKITNAAVKTTVEAVIEWGLGKVLGGTHLNTLIGLRDGKKTVFKGITKTTGAKYFVKSAAQEGLEEFLQDFSTNCVDQFYDLVLEGEGYGDNGVTIQTLIDSFLIGALSSMFMSGGNVAFSETTSAIRNLKNPGSGDMVIETPDGIQKVRGLNRLYYSSILSEFNNAVDKLKRGKINPHKNVELAQEIYNSLSVISQFYSSFSAERIKNCELLLSRVIEAEKFEQQYGSTTTVSNGETVVQNTKAAKKATKFAVKHASKDFATYVGNTFQSMVGELSLKHVKNLTNAAKKVEKKLTKDGGVTEVTGAVDTDGIRYKRDPDMTEVEKMLGKKGMDVLNELRQGYEWVIMTDGHIACETGDMHEFLFVSEAWLKNYTASDIYKYLAQANVLETLATKEEFAPMVKKLIAFDKEFTGQTDVDAERALMDFLFNESVYQAFLLSNAGENMHEFEAFIFQFHDIMKDIASKSKYHQQLFKGKQSQKRINMLNQIYEQIKETMRKPTLKAILNWNIPPQSVNADSVLTEKDRETVNKYGEWRRTLSGTRTDRSAYENLKEDIIAQANFNAEELALVRKSGTGKLTIDEEIEARALLDEADRRMTRYDFEVSPDYSYYLVSVDKIVERLKSIDFVKNYDVAMTQLTEIIDDIETHVNEIRNRADIPEKLRDRISFWYERSFESDLINKGAGVDLNLIAMSGVQLIRDYCAHIEKNTMKHRKKVGLGAFVVPYQAAAIAMNDGDIAGAQFVADKLNEFESVYGISARQMITGDLSGMSMAQRNQLTQDMEVLEVGNIALFVIKKLEGMLGNKYVVTPTHFQFKPDRNGFTVVANPTFNESKDWARLSERLETDRNSVTRWFEERKNVVGAKESRAYTLVEEFYEYTTTLHPSNYSDFNEFLTDENKAFWKELGKLYRNQSASSAFKYILSNKDLILAQFDTVDRVLSQSASKEALKGYDDTHVLSNVYDFTIARAIPAETLLSHNILAEDVETRNAIFKQAFSFEDVYSVQDIFERVYDEVSGLVKAYDTLPKVIQEMFSKEELSFTEKEMSILKTRVEFGEDMAIVYGEFVNTLAQGVNPFTGEVFAEDGMPTSTGEGYYELFHYNMTQQMEVPSRPLSDFIDISAFPTIMLDDVRVYFEDAGEGNAGYAVGSKIVIDPEKDGDHFGTLVHEVNHILQDRYNMPGGFNSKTARAMPDFLAYVVNHYPNYIKYTLRRTGYGDDIEIIYGEDGDANITKEFLLEMPTQIYNLIAHCGYMLVQGELWARAYTHNGKPVHGFAEIFGTQGNYLLAPDGKTKFKVVHNTSDTSEALTTRRKDLETEMTDVLKVIDKIYQVNFRGRAKAYENESLRGWVIKFYETSRLLFSDTIKTFLEPVDRNWIDTFVQQLMEPARSKDTLKVIANNRAKVKAIYQKAIANIEKASVSASTSIPQETSYTSDVVAGSALDVAIQKLFLLKGQQERRGYAATSRNTYHSGFTKSSALAMTQQILSPNAPWTAKYTVRLGDIIRDPQSYLAPEILAMCNGDFSEGNVFYRIKEYVEAKVDGVSIDITDGPNPQYVWVDDNAFDDLLLTSMKSKVESQETTLATKYKAGEHIPLTEFYSARELTRLGVNPSAYIVFGPNVATETVFDNEHRTGAIFIKVNEKTTDAKIIDSLNHEFRHLLQRYNGFATGFTPNFKVSREMIEDVKKHVPGLFENNTIVRWAKALADTKGDITWEEVIVQRFVYYATSGELNAYAFNARDLYAKPILVNKEAGNPVIFMPWYDAKTGEGRYKTEFLAMRADDADTKNDGEKPDKSISIPRVDKPKKYKSATKNDLNDPSEKPIYKYDRRRDFTKKKAEGTNLKFFIKKGQRNQMDPDLQEFVIATTGHEDELPKELWNVIGGKHAGTLTKQALFKWFRTVSADKINDFTFDLMNKCFFKNDYISSINQLDDLLKADPSFYWAAAVVLHSEGISLKSLLVENDVDTFKAFLKTLEGSKWKKKIEKLQAKFTDMSVLLADGSYTEYNITYSEKLEKYMRVLAMQWFNGTLAGAFYVGNAFRKSIRLNEQEYVNMLLSTDEQVTNSKGDTTSLGANMTEGNQVKSIYAGSANDIIALYEMEFLNVSRDDMFVYAVIRYYEDLLAEAGLDPRTASPSELKPFQEKAVEYQRQLNDVSYDELLDTYIALKNSEITGIHDDKAYDKSKNRVNIVASIKRISTRIINLVRKGEIRFNELPKAVQDMYQLVDSKTENGKKVQVYELKPEVYSVGRGRVRKPVETSKGRFYYVEKHNLADGNQEFRHDTTQILANLELLRETLLAANQVIKDRKKGSKKNEVGAITSRGEKASRELINVLNKAKAAKRTERGTKETEFRIAKKKRTSDTPNIFNVVSAIDMPAVLYKILDTSFEDFADTEVQFASRDKNGQLFDKTQFKRGEFDSRVKHEVSNWDAFYEANRDALLSLSRNDVLDIIEFYQRGAAILGGPTNKFAAFEIFLLGYIVDGTRRNFNNWNFSDAEIEMIEKLYEQKASEHGSGLQAVQQMLKVVDPMKKVRQRMFDDWDAISDGDKDDLIAKVDEMQTEKDDKKRKELAQEVLQMLDQFSKRQIATDKSKYPRWSKEWWRRLGAKTKSFRYLSMLSGPATWVRNTVSNVVVTGLNKTSDTIGGIIFTKKGYRKDQWNLAGTKISPEAKSFIDTYILSNPIFNPTKEDIKNGAPNIYNLSSKYDERQTKKIKDERGLLVTLIAKAYQRQYTQDHRFDSKAMVAVGKFIDQRISDEKFVKFVAGRYFGKILTIEAQRGNIDLSQGLSAETLNLFAESVVLANQEYMHKRSFLADFLDGIRDKHPVAYDVLNFWQPFLNSSFNWFVESLKYTPIGLAGAIVRANRLEAQITKLDAKRAKGEMVADSRTAEFFIRRDIGKGTVGLFLSILGMLLAASGRLRIDEDDDKFYLFIDEELKIDISDVFASSSTLVGASIAQKFIAQADGKTASIEDVLSMATNVMLDGFFAADILDRHKWGGTWEDILTESESIFRSFVPQFFQTLAACTNNDKIRYSPGLKGIWERWVNSWAPGQPLGNRKINPYTGEIEDKYSLPIIGGILQKGILGAKIYWVDVTEEERMCRELNVNKNELTGELTVNNKKYELDRLALNKKYGELNKDSLAKIKSQKHTVEMPDGTFKTLSWDKMSDKQRANVLSRTFTQNADIAKIYMWTQVMGKKFYASASLLQTLRSLGITQNVYRGDKGFVE